MEFWLNKLHERHEPPGFETTLLKRMPLILLFGSLLPVGVAGLMRLLHGIESARLIASVDIFLLAALITFWTAVLTVTIACFIIYVMKGPAYVADAYALNEADRPRR